MYLDPRLWALTVGVPQPYRGTIKLALAKESGFGAGGHDERMTPVESDSEGAKTAVTRTRRIEKLRSPR